MRNLVHMHALNAAITDEPLAYPVAPSSARARVIPAILL